MDLYQLLEWEIWSINREKGQKGPGLKWLVDKKDPVPFGKGAKMERVDKTNYYLDIAETILERGTCLRNNYGSVIVKNDEIISTG